jgi:hypothetical protein
MRECARSTCQCEADVVSKLGEPVCLEHAWWREKTDATVRSQRTA